MTNYEKLSTIKDNDGCVDFMANSSKGNYINLGGINNIDTIKCIRDFLVTYKVWCITDIIVNVKKPINFVPVNYHNISFVLHFYELARKNKEKKNREKHTEINKIENQHNIEKSIVIGVKNDYTKQLEKKDFKVELLSNDKIRHLRKKLDEMMFTVCDETPIKLLDDEKNDDDSAEDSTKNNDAHLKDPSRLKVILKKSK